MDLDSIIIWFTETLPEKLSQWYDVASASIGSFWDTVAQFCVKWFDLSVAYLTQAWEKFPALMEDWGAAISELLAGLRRSLSEFLPDAAIQAIAPVPDWAIFIVAPLLVLLLLIFILKKIFGRSNADEKPLKSVESPEVPTLGELPKAEDVTPEDSGEELPDVPDIPEPGRSEPVIRLRPEEETEPHDEVRREPKLTSVEENAPKNATEQGQNDEAQTPQSIGPAELQSRIRNQLGVDENPDKDDLTKNVEAKSAEPSENENLLGTAAQRDIADSLNRIRAHAANTEEPAKISGDDTGDKPEITETPADPKPTESTAPSMNPSVPPPEQAGTPSKDASEPSELDDEKAKSESGPRITFTVPQSRDSAATETDEKLPEKTDGGTPEDSGTTPEKSGASVTSTTQTAADESSAEDEPPSESSAVESEAEAGPASTSVPAPPGPLLATIARLEEGLRVSERLAAQDPASAQAQRDVAISMSRLGDALVEAGDLSNAISRFEQSLTISERLAEQNPTSAEALRDVAVSLNRLGDAQVEQGEIDQALSQFQMGLKISQRLAEQSPSNAQAQRDVWISLNRIGDIRVKAGDIASATAHFETGHQISQRLADFNPGNIEAQRDLIVSCAKLGEVSPGQGWWARGLAVCERLAMEGRLPPADGWMLEDLRRRSAADSGQ